MLCTLLEINKSELKNAGEGILLAYLYLSIVHIWVDYMIL